MCSDIGSGLVEGSAGEQVIKGAEKLITCNLNDLPINVKNSYSKYSQNGWKGIYEGQTPGTKAGSKYYNYDGKLPKTDTNGIPITYQEFDVNNHIPGSTRDAERFVRGSDGTIYYTDSHYGQGTSPGGYSDFVKIK